MGDGESDNDHRYVKWNPGWHDACHSAPSCIQVTYTPRTDGARKGFAGIWLQSPGSSWGQAPGLNLTGYTRISFWAKAADTGTVVRFRVGGSTPSTAKFPDTVAPVQTDVVLTKEWQPYELSLANQNLTNVAGGFAWIVETASNNNRRVTFFIDDIVYTRSGR
jgi:hypothetical protein